MGKKRFLQQNEIDSFIESNFVKVSEGVGGYLFFEIEKHCTTDILEAVSIMMRKGVKDPKIWSTDIQKNIDIEHLETRHCLYWLSGGDDEWNKREFYKRPWNECDLLFQEEFSSTIFIILKKSKTLGDIKNGFLKFLNLPVFYEFALSHNLI
jgi:hypothetical protein